LEQNQQVDTPLIWNGQYPRAAMGTSLEEVTRELGMDLRASIALAAVAVSACDPWSGFGALFGPRRNWAACG